MVRSPSGPASSTSAPSSSNAGGVSPEKAAQQKVPPGATWQTVPSFLRQKSLAWRQK